jgi:hypothetical protein
MPATASPAGFSTIVSGAAAPPVQAARTNPARNKTLSMLVFDFIFIMLLYLNIELINCGIARTELIYNGTIYSHGGMGKCCWTDQVHP